MNTHEMIAILRISDNPQKLATADELERLLNENARLTADLAWIHHAASWLKNNNVNPRAWQCIQDIIDRAEGGK